MINLLPYLFLLVCPVMMFFMMRGMHGGHGGHDATDQAQQPERPAVTGARDDRLAELEREVATLRADRDHSEANRP